MCNQIALSEMCIVVNSHKRKNIADKRISKKRTCVAEQLGWILSHYLIFTSRTQHFIITLDANIRTNFYLKLFNLLILFRSCLILIIVERNIQHARSCFVNVKWIPLSALGVLILKTSSSHSMVLKIGSAFKIDVKTTLKHLSKFFRGSDAIQLEAAADSLQDGCFYFFSAFTYYI